MGLLSFLNRRTGEQRLKQFLAALEEMIREGERTYRGKLDLLNSEGINAIVSGQGLLKARLLGASYLVYTFMSECSPDEQCLRQFMQMASGAAFRPFSEDNSYPRLSREHALEFAGSFMMSALKAITSELRDGPSLPTQRTSGFKSLVGLYQDAICDSVGKDVHQRQSERHGCTLADRLDHFIASEGLASLRHMTDWMRALAADGPAVRTAFQKMFAQ